MHIYITFNQIKNGGFVKMNDGLYKMILSDVKKNLDETTQPVLRADIKKMSSKQKNERIRELEDENHKLKTELIIRKSVDERYISGLIQSKEKQMYDLLNNPILTLPSGKQICFNALTQEQLYFLEQLAEKQEEPRKTK